MPTMLNFRDSHYYSICLKKLKRKVECWFVLLKANLAHGADAVEVSSVSEC